jgi:CHASE3 domain sensor protein
MGGGGSIAGMVISLKNNNSLRTHRKRLFNRDKSGINKEGRKPLKYKHLSEKELKVVREEIAEKNRAFNYKKVLVLIISILITTSIVILLLNFSDEILRIFVP